MSGRPTEVFLSHASADRVFADAFAATFIAHGVPVWYSRTNLLDAQLWIEEIGLALDRCDWFIVLTSNAAALSTWLKREAGYALGQSQFFGRLSVIALDECDPKLVVGALASIQQTRMSGDFEAACASVLRAWGIGLDHTRIRRPS